MQFTTNDNSIISYQSYGAEDSPICIILIHGFSGSSEYFTRNIDTLSGQHRVVTYDLRGHGSSGRPAYGHHICRLAVDLRELIDVLRQPNQQYVGVGCSIGSAILWCYIELFGDKDWLKFCFVDQAPLQNYAEDWTIGNYGCHDAASLRAAQKALIENPVENARNLARSCLGYLYASDPEPDHSGADQKFFIDITLQCDGHWLALLLADHTAYDHRPTIKNITKPTLVCVGKKSGCFPLEGMTWTANTINKLHPGLATVCQFDAGHWLYYEDPDHFNEALLEFIRA